MKLGKLRRTKALRDLVRETRLSTGDFVYPIFVVEGENKREEIPSMPGQFRISVDKLEDEIKELKEKRIRSVLLFGIPAEKDELASEAYNPEGIVQKAVREIKRISPETTVITDVCLCEYKSDGHCCYFEEDHIDLEKTLETLSETALSHARAGADIVAPSDMMDEHILSIRKKLDQNGYSHIPVMGYSAKFASAFYGPFREAADSAPAYGDRRSYQMDPANRREALRELEADETEGADILMVKPAMSYLDIIRDARENSDLPLAAYQVSGEYSMLKKAVDEGLLDESALYESLLSIKRAGADIIISYFSKDVPELIEKYEKR